MSSQRHLKELLREDQEPFFISPKKCHLKKQPSLKQLQLTKKKPTQNASFHSNFCKNACLFSSSSAFPVDSPDYRKSPLWSPATLTGKSPSRAMLLHVPAKTAAVLLEAACRIHRKSKPKSQTKTSGFGLFGSVIKRITNRTRKPELADPDSDVIRWADSVKSSRRPSVCSRVGPDSGLVEKSDLVEDRTGRLSSVWSEENKSLASSSSTSTSCSRTASGNLSEHEEKIRFQNENVRNINEDFTFCLSPLSSPFRFALQKSPSPGLRSPAFCSPITSPSRRNFQENVDYEQQDCAVKFQVDEEEEEKEQCSPVSILDPPFGDDDCEEEEGECHEEEDKFDIEFSYAFVQRAKQQLLQKLRRFEILAELDPIELEKRMVDEEEEEEDLEYEADVEDDVERGIELYLADISMRSGLAHELVNPGMKRLLSDLISEEERLNSPGDDYESLIKRVCKRLDSWKEVDPNTIEMMVAMDLKGKKDDTWQNRADEISQIAKIVELSIFGGLLDELIMMS